MQRAAQRSRLLELLRAAGHRGVSVLELIHKHNILRASGRILELRRQGYAIETLPGPGGTAIYVLRGEPAALHAPGPHHTDESPTKQETTLPLFAGERQ
jgi:hypothetical protein